MLSAEERKDIESIGRLAHLINSKALMTTTLTKDPVSLSKGELGNEALNFAFCICDGYLRLLYWFCRYHGKI